jgi:hypothetical protein
MLPLGWIGRGITSTKEERYIVITYCICVTIAFGVLFFFKINLKHPELPMKPTTSFMLFYMEQKDAVLEKQPDLGMVLEGRQSSIYLN